MKYFLLFHLFLSFNIISFGQIESHEYLDSDFPNETPKLFADSIFSEFGTNKCLYVSPDKKYTYFSSCGYTGFCQEILRLGKLSNSKTIVLDTILNAEKTNKFSYCVEPWISYDRQEMYFSASKDIWKLTKINNKWSNPEKLGSNINTSWLEGHPSISKNNTLYFHSWEKTAYENSIYYSKYKDNAFTARKKIDILSEIGDAGDPAIAPDESFIIFASSRDGGYGLCDLYISFNKENKWTKPINLGSKINTSAIELGATITQDGKFLFFSRRDKWKNSTFLRVYWVSIDSLLMTLHENSKMN